MITATKILPYRLKRRLWEVPRNYVLTISNEKTVDCEQALLNFRIPLRLTMTKFNAKCAVYWLQTGRPTFNGSRDYDKLQWVFVRLFSLNKKVRIRTHPSGRVWEICNEQQIREQWPAVKQQVLELYDDPLVENILARHEQNLNHHFQSMYRQDPMLQLLFNDLFGDYAEDQPAEKEKTLARHLGDIPFPIIEGKQLSQLYSLKKTAIIAVDGRPDPDRLDQQAVNEYLGQVLGDGLAVPYKFIYKGEYEMDTARANIREASLKVKGTLGNSYTKSMNYHLICTDKEQPNQRITN